MAGWSQAALKSTLYPSTDLSLREVQNSFSFCRSSACMMLSRALITGTGTPGR